MLTAPGGSPELLKISARKRAEEGVKGEVLKTQVQPAANAGASFHEQARKGKFHGTICPTVPIGSRIVISSPWLPTGIELPTKSAHKPA
jgi:hypothetical protein